MAIRDPIIDHIVCLPLLFCVSGSPSKCNHSSSRIVSQRISSSFAFYFTLQRIFWTRESNQTSANLPSFKLVSRRVCPRRSTFCVVQCFLCLLSFSRCFHSQSRYPFQLADHVSQHATYPEPHRKSPSSERRRDFILPFVLFAVLTLSGQSFDIPPSFSEPFYYFNLYSSGKSRNKQSQRLKTNIRAPADREREHVVFALARVPCRIVIYLAAVRGLACCYTVGGPADRAAAHAQQIALDRIGALDSRV